MFDFSTAVIGTDSQYIQEPGYYKANIVETQLVKPDDNKTPHLAVTFETAYGKITERFFISAKALGRLKALFFGIWGKELTKVFGSVDEVGDYFKQALNKKKEVLIKVIGEKVGDRIYHKLSFNDFIVEDPETKEEIIKPEYTRYGNFVTIRKQETAPVSSTIIPPKPVEVPSWKEVGKKEEVDDENDLPF